MNNKFFDKMYEVLGSVAGKLNENIYINSIKDGMLAYMPFTFIASIFLIIAFLPIQPYQDFMTSVFGEGFVPALTMVNNASLGIGGVLVLLTVSRNLAEKMEINALQIQLTALVSYLLLVPFGADEAGNFVLRCSVDLFEPDHFDRCLSDVSCSGSQRLEDQDACKRSSCCFGPV